VYWLKKELKLIAEKGYLCQMVRQRRKSRLLPSIQNKLLEQLVAGVSARTAAELTGEIRT
jgi:hypothetical protein